MSGNSKLKAQSSKGEREGELWLWQDCLVSGPGGELLVLRTAPIPFPCWHSPELAAGDFRASVEKDLLEAGLKVAEWIGQGPEIRRAA